MSSNKTDEKSISVPDKLKQGVYGDTINVSGVEISWDVRGGTCSFRGIPVAMMWVDSTLAGLMSGVQSMVGTERFNLALQAEGRKSVESDWLLISLYDDFAEGFAQLNLNAKVAGWGDWQLVAHNPERRECVFRAFNNWEGGYQKALGVYWGSGMLAGKLAGICGKLFDTNCWATQTRFVANGDPYDEFVVVPSERSLEQEIENLLGSDQATRADMAVALQRLQAAEEILRENEYRYNQLVRKIPDGIYTFQFATDGAMDFKYVSPRLCEILNLDAEAVMKNSRLAFTPVHPDDLDGLVRENDKARVTLQPFRWEGRFLIHGDTRWIRISSDPTPLPDGGSLWHGVVSDITQSKQAEDTLGASHQILRNILDTTLEGYWRVDSSGKLIDVNPAYSRQSGYALEELLGMRVSGLEAVESPTETAERIRRIIESGGDRFETRHRRKDGSIWDVEVSTTFSPVDGGGIVAFFRDITERKKAESELRIAAAAFDSQEAMVVTDANSVILRVNRAFTEITGYLPEEVVGQNPRVLKSNRHAPDFYRAMWETINRAGGWQGEIWDRRKNGEEYPKWLTISAVRDGSGNITHYIGAHFDITERKKAEEKIEALAFFDQLTGLPNRFSLQERLTQAQSLAGRNEKQLAVMLIDLDNFKTINDTLGHQMGDKLLTQVAIRLADSIRQSDLVARLGGDEFVVVLPEIDSPADAANVADKILKAVSAPYLVDGHQLRTSPSIGICLFPGDATETQDLIKKADVAMYHAKAKGRGNYQFFKEEIQAAAVKRLAIEADLRTALAKQQFVLYYQPQLDLRTGRLVGVEALVRWQHPERGLVPPDDFIPIAEETGLILPMGDWVIQQACRQLADWRAGGIEHIRISVNLSASQFLDRELPYLIQAQMKKYALSPESLDLEVTESMTMASPENTIVSMKVLKENGLTLSIDDFGTGYSSLSYLKMFPVSTLKIDRSFVKDIETDQNDADICDVTVLLAHKLGMDVVAEGVETKAQLKYLQSIGCEKIQGYLISKPLPADKAEEFIRSHQPMTGLGTVDVWKYS